MERLKHGAVGDDGRIFWQYRGDREVWVTQERFNINKKSHKAASRRYYATNKEKHRSAVRAWQDAHKERCYLMGIKWRKINKEQAARHSRKSTLKRIYKLTLDSYERMLEMQDGVCAICGNNCSTGRRLAVDHDHVTKKVRGLLCSNCNRAIGLLKDSPTAAKKASEYLVYHRMLDSPCMA